MNDFLGDGSVTRGFWPPRSPDFRSPDFLLWGFLKESTAITQEARKARKHKNEQGAASINKQKLPIFLLFCKITDKSTITINL